jgi:hypothetical protein
MSYYATYSPLFTGSMDDPSLGVRIDDYENFDHIRTTVHDEWAFSPEIEWETEDQSSYPKEQYAHLYGFTYHDDSLSRYDECDSWSINKLAPPSPLFNNLWYAVAMTCEPFSVLMHESAAFPRTNALALHGGDLTVHRLDAEPGCITRVEVPLDGGDEEVVDTYEWEADTYREERFPGGINY